MVGIVLISHSSSLAAGAAELVGQIAGGARVVPAGGTEDGQLGTSSRLIGEAIAKADQGAGVLLIPDLGSAVLTARVLLEEENRRLRRENERLKEERDILKKATAFFARDER